MPRRSAAALVVAVLCAGCSAATPLESAAARGYLDRALAALHDHSMDVRPATWPAIVAHAEDLARRARTPPDTYPAIRYAISAIGDPHTRFLTPQQVRQFNGVDASSYTPPSGTLIGHRFVLFELPEVEGNAQAINGYVSKGIAALQHLDASAPCGWIVDLRDNGGGNMWPMLTVVLPLLRGSPVGFSVRNNLQRTPWVIRDGRITGPDPQTVAQANTYRLRVKAPAVAVLTDQATASSGEAALIAFRGQPHVRTFGLPTAGLPSDNTVVTLPDRADLLITSARFADRTGHVYPNLTPIQPDTQIGHTTHLPPGEPWRPTAPPEALQWLANQRSCASPTVAK